MCNSEPITTIALGSCSTNLTDYSLARVCQLRADKLPCLVVILVDSSREQHTFKCATPLFWGRQHYVKITLLNFTILVISTMWYTL